MFLGNAMKIWNEYLLFLLEIMFPCGNLYFVLVPCNTIMDIFDF